jgi:predicted glycoside hydrolase/deacetylase ChbG (UPF0249 family)
MTILNKGQTNRLLGYPVDARLLIINADDFGMCNAINEAIIRTMTEGVVRSTSLMVPCPWSLQAMRFLADHPEIPFGVHLTVICDADNYTWGPVTSWEKVPSLVDRAGNFYNVEGFPRILNQDDLNQLEVEFRAQIETVLAVELKPAHLDWHSLHLDGRADIVDLMLRLAKEYGLTLRITGRPWIEKMQNQGLPTNDYNLLDSFSLNPVNKSARYAQMLHEIPDGLSEWAVHPGLDNAELLTLEPDGNHSQQTDFNFWISQQAKDIVKEEGIILLDYRALQEVWAGK